jgi:NAD(P)-dependent dehydrogenase (short-subunit alcohol dehydrogenase family)
VRPAHKPVFLLTGGSRGIGEVIALQAARAGYQGLQSYSTYIAGANLAVAGAR